MRRLIFRHEQKTFPRIVNRGKIITGTAPAGQLQTDFTAQLADVAPRQKYATAGHAQLTLQGKATRADFSVSATAVEVVINGFYYRLALSAFKGEGTASGGATELRSDIPGRIVKIFASAGDIVAEGHPLLIHEAMKMEIVLKAPQRVKIAELLVTEGAQVEADMVLMRFEGAEGK